MSAEEKGHDAEATKTKQPPRPAILFVILAGISLIAILVLVVVTEAMAQVQAALFAAAISSFGLALVRLADGFAEQVDPRKPRRETRYARFWLTCFAVVFAGLILTGTLSRIPSQIETPWLRATRQHQPPDARCAALRDPRATDVQFFAALRAGCR